MFSVDGLAVFPRCTSIGSDGSTEGFDNPSKVQSQCVEQDRRLSWP